MRAVVQVEEEVVLEVEVAEASEAAITRVSTFTFREVIPWFKSSFQLRMDDRKHTEIPVSRVQTKRLRALLKL